MTKHAPSILLGGAGLSWLAGQAVLPDRGLTTAERYEAVVGSQPAEAWSAALLVVAGCLMVLGAVSTARATSAIGGRGARLTRWGTAMLALGGMWLVGGRAAFNMVFLRVTDDAVPREVALSVLDDPGGFEFLPLVLTLPCLLLGPVLLAVGLRRAEVARWTPLMVWVVGIATFVITEFATKIGEVVGIGLAAAALLMIGLAVARASSDVPGLAAEPHRAMAQ